ncbi:IPT/TIG domain-containing protein [Solwaraspora sp. WMMD792]|uniref:beta strand repeat-containing protein n=1 Tax=Solwaraspora sp. WMMD792 TaxID=3016099 RepID=UPI002417FA0D|nr:IPT/TIG domain-containing protein [Solwaraspora sp. WMMD792]MDG4769108.1 IPT/TIG domain-containing protein [Solwaraspora sp. WMMD792]
MKRVAGLSLAALLGTAGGLAVTATPAHAAPGDAQARGVVVDLSAEVLGVPVVQANAVIGSATAPPGGGTDTETLIDITLPGAIGVTADGTVLEVSATRGPISSFASSSVADVSLNILGLNVLTATAVEAAVSCPYLGPQTADTTLTGLTVFGSAEVLVPNGPSLDASAAVTVPGLVGASLDVSLSRVETVAADSAAAATIVLTAELSGEILGVPVVIPVGTVIIAEATCERPAAPAPPTASSIDPDSGPQSGGQTVTITGSGFVPNGTSVTFDGVPATDVVVDPSGTSLTAVTPPGAVGPADVVVTTDGGSTDPLAYTYLADGSDAVVTGLDPDFGPTSGGTTVTITGSGFTGATGVTFDGVAGSGFAVNPAGTEITVVTPPGAAGPADVVITFPAGTADAGIFTYVPPTPTASSIDPDSGPQSGGQTVTITGSGFVPNGTSVTFDGVPATDVVVDPSGTSLTAVTPPGAVGPADVVVTTDGGSTDPLAYTYLADGSDAVVTGLDPDFGPTSGGTTVTITGSGFTGATGVTFDGVAGSGFAVNPAGTEITVVTPPGAAGPADVVITFPAGTADAGIFTYVPPTPTASSIDPDSGPQSGGQTVTITGSGFVPNGTSVTFDGVPATDVVVDPSGTSLTAVTPPGAVGPADVVVTTDGGSTDPLAYTYLADGSDAVVTGLDPDFGPTSGGTTVTITGSGFTGATGVTFDGVAGSGFAVNPAGTEITVVTPPGAAGPADVVITFPAGTADAGIFTYVPPTPTASSIDPDSGPQSGGQTVTITGSGFVPNGTSVTFDGVPATDVVVDPSGTSLTAVTPPGAVGPADVVVTTDGGSTDPLAYTYLADGSDAVVTGLDPDFGPTSGGTTVTITGSGFTGATGVTFDGVAGSGFAVNPAGTEITVVTPPGAAGPADVVITFPAGTADAGIFTYVPPTPTASSIDPDSGPQSGGQTVTITGSGFVPNGTSVTFDGVPATDVVVDPSGTSLTAVTPPGAVGPADVVVTTDGGSTDPLAYTYLADGSDAVVTGLDPDFGPTSGGTTVTITGSGFTGATGVTFDGVAGSGFAVNPAGTEITVVTPPGAAGPADVVITFPAGTADAGIFTYVPPTIDSVVPDSGPNTGGTTVTITGSGFTGATDVTFGGVPGTDLVVDPSGTSLTVVTPPGPVGPVDVVVVLPGDDAVAPDGFTYSGGPAPVIDSVDPGQGPANGGTTVVVGGGGFIPGQTTVTICGKTIPANNVTVNSSGTSLTFVTPPCDVKNTTITVTTPNGTSNEIAFRYVGLPVTGTATTNLITSGGALVALGISLLLLTRRRANRA